MDHLWHGDEFALRYHMMLLDESESLITNFDEGTMNHKEIDMVFLHADYQAYQ